MILILLPAYDEADSIGPLLSKIQQTMERHGYEYKVRACAPGADL